MKPVARVVAREPGAKRQTVRVNFTKRTLDVVELPRVGDRRWLYDLKVPALAMMVTATGAKSFYVYKRVDGRPQRIRIGDYPAITPEQARQAAGKLLGEIARGDDPQERRRQKRREQTFAQLWESWLTDYAKPRLRTWHQAERLYELYLDGWKHRRVSSISRADVQALHVKIGTSAPYQANRLLELLRGLWNWKNGDRTGPNPARGVPPYDETERERFLDAAELARFVEALKAEPSETFRDFVLLALHTAARRSNVISMKWADIDLGGAVWTIPGPEYKNKKPHRIPLTAPALEILRRRKEAAGDSLFVLPGPGARGHYAGPRENWGRLVERAKLPGVRLHDLRRTAGSWMLAGGASIEEIGKALGHRSQQATRIYARLKLDKVRAAMNATAAAMLAATATKLEGADDGKE